MRLQQYMASCGVASRRASEVFITAGRVTINGQVATLGQSVNPSTDDVRLDGQSIAKDDKVYIILNKPRGVVTTAKDTHGRRTVVHLVEDVPSRVFPVGRLDYDVEGALLMTNDGELAFRLTHPKYGIEKLYRVRVKGRVSKETARELEKGVILDDGKTAPAKVKILSAEEWASDFELTLTEGRKREVKRMCMHVGHPVLALERIAFAGITAKDLPHGKWRMLSPSEVNQLRKQTDTTAK